MLYYYFFDVCGTQYTILPIHIFASANTDHQTTCWHNSTAKKPELFTTRHIRYAQTARMQSYVHHHRQRAHRHRQNMTKFPPTCKCGFGCSLYFIAHPFTSRQGCPCLQHTQKKETNRCVVAMCREWRRRRRPFLYPKLLWLCAGKHDFIKQNESHNGWQDYMCDNRNELLCMSQYQKAYVSLNVYYNYYSISIRINQSILC